MLVLFIYQNGFLFREMQNTINMINIVWVVFIYLIYQQY